MHFIILRQLKHAELGFFMAYRTAGKEVSRQRAINFDGEVVDRIFPAAKDTDEIPLELSYLGEGRTRIRQDQALRRQEKNWRLTGDCVKDTFFDFVEPDCLFVLRVDCGRSPAQGVWAVFGKNDEVTRAILASGDSSKLAKSSMVALYGDECRDVEAVLASRCPELVLDPNAPVVPEVQSASAEVSVSEFEIGADGTVNLPPDPSRTIDLLASVGYTLPSAVADLVDNAVAALATTVDITFGRPDDGHGRWLAVVDDGGGMDRLTLMEAMRIGSRRGSYEPRALGKYGYGLKGASWSQADRVTVVTRKQGESIHQLCWDRQYLQRVNRWEAQVPTLEEWEKNLTAAKIPSRGTAVLWTKMRPPTQTQRARGSKATPFELEIADLERYLGMVFHRFIEGRAQGTQQVTITINGRPVEPTDPAMARSPLTITGDQRSIQIPVGETEARARFQTFILPAEQEVRNHYAAEGEVAIQAFLRRIRLEGRQNEAQGVYVYRNDRLISWGGWRDLFAPDEHTKLLRAVLDFDSDLDDALKVNISKREVSFPLSLAEQLRNFLKQPRADARKRYDNPPLPVPDPAAPVAPTGTPPASPVDGQAPVSASGPAAPAPAPAGADGPGAGTAVPAVPAPEPTSIRKVKLTGSPWKIRSGLGNRVLEVNLGSKKMMAIQGAIAGKDEAVAALADLLQAIDGLPAEIQGEIKRKMEG